MSQLNKNVKRQTNNSSFVQQMFQNQQCQSSLAEQQEQFGIFEKQQQEMAGDILNNQF